MPRERGLNYTPDADGYSFEDTGIGEAAQASFHRLASGYPQQEPDQQEPDDIHHLADVITGIRDSTFADMELRRASGLYSMTQARAIDTILDRAGALRQHYQDRRLEQRQNERDQWADLLRATKALLPEWDNDDVNRLIHDLDHPRDAMETLAQVWQPDNTILVAPDWETIHRYIQAVPFTASDDYPKVNGEGDAYDIRDKHVYGDIPTDLEDRTASVTRYYVNAPEPAGWTLNSQGQYVPIYDEPVERQLLTYEVHQVDHNVHHFDPKSITMITADPEQLEHWRRTGIIDAGQPVIIMTTEAQVAEIWSERGYLDHNTTVMVIDPNTEPESWAREFPAEAQLVYTTIPRSAEAQLVHDRNIFGEIPHHLKVKAQTYTSWPHDEPTGAYGYPVPRRATILLRTPLPEIPT